MARKERSKKRRKSRELNAVGKKRTTKAGISDQINNIRVAPSSLHRKGREHFKKLRSKKREEKKKGYQDGLCEPSAAPAQPTKCRLEISDSTFHIQDWGTNTQFC